MSEDTPTNVVDEVTPNQLADNFFNSLNRGTKGNVELYVKHAGGKVSANEITFSHKMGGANLIPGFYTEPIGNKTIEQIRGPGHYGDAVDNFYKVQVNTDNLLINIQKGEFRGKDRFVETNAAGRSRLLDQIEKIDWDIFAKETGLSFGNLVEISPNSFKYNDAGKRVAFVDVQTFTKVLAREVGDTELAFTALRKAGIEGFVSGPTNAQYEVVLLDPNDDLGIGKRINIEDATLEQFKTSKATANPVDEIIIDTPPGLSQGPGTAAIDDIAFQNTQLIDNLPIEQVVKDRWKNMVAKRYRNLATPGGALDAVDVWEFGVMGLMMLAIAYKEYDEIPTIFSRTATNMFNSMTALYNIPPVPLEQYELDYEFMNKVLETGEKVMPTDILSNKVKEVVKGVGETGTVTGFGYVPTASEKTDTIDKKPAVQFGVQEEKMFEKEKPKTGKSGGGGEKMNF